MIAILQGLRELIEYLLLKTVPESQFTHKMVTMAAMIFLTFVVLIYAKLTKTKLIFFPARFSKGYIIITCVAAAVFITCPSNFTQGYKAILTLIYGSIVTTVYEEIIFRGYLWNRINSVVSKEIYTYLWSVALFTAWHIGYMIPNIIDGNYVAVLWKLAAGVGYGAVIGFIRLKTNNCYAGVLAHGILNVFMI